MDGLQRKLDSSYRPGLGEFMGSIQIHHAKLWFAGKGQNWKLADFEIGEIRESIEGIKKYCMDRTETKSIGMIEQPIESVSKAIELKNELAFEKSFNLLTLTCNNCHQTTNHAFNVIKAPETPPFSNQQFSVKP